MFNICYSAVKSFLDCKSGGLSSVLAAIGYASSSSTVKYCASVVAIIGILGSIYFNRKAPTPVIKPSETKQEPPKNTREEMQQHKPFHENDPFERGSTHLRCQMLMPRPSGQQDAQPLGPPNPQTKIKDARKAADFAEAELNAMQSVHETALAAVEAAKNAYNTTDSPENAEQLLFATEALSRAQNELREAELTLAARKTVLAIYQ